jgi:DNA recombination protein RmuC
MKAERDEQRARAEAAEKKLEGQSAQMKEREAGIVREREQLQKLQAEGEMRFKALADAALLKSQQQFVAIADETLKKHQAGASGELGKMLKPIQESFGEFKTKVDAIQKERAEDRAKLSEQITQVGNSVRQTEMVAGKLATALSSTKGGGRWGEETLRNVLEMAGLSPYADFTEQTSNQTEKGRQRPGDRRQGFAGRLSRSLGRDRSLAPQAEIRRPCRPGAQPRLGTGQEGIHQGILRAGRLRRHVHSGREFLRRRAGA